MDFLTVYERHKADLDQVESLLYDCVQSRHPALTAASVQLLEAGGKRIRPLLALVCSHFGQAPRTRAVYQVAAALELIHMATLVHDDVIDNADRRRGRPTVRARYGDRVAMYTGDFLFGRAIALLSGIGRNDLHRDIAAAMVSMCRGEIEQIQHFYDWRQSLKQYLRRVERKTALLIAVSCASGAATADAPATVVRQLRRFGHLVGMAFQITDDVLDYTGDPGVVGKPVGGDLRQGNLTLPALHAAAHGMGEPLKRLVHPDAGEERIREAVRLVSSSPSLEYARRIADRYLNKALRVLEPLSDEPAAADLRVLAEFVNHRER